MEAQNMTIDIKFKWILWSTTFDIDIWLHTVISLSTVCNIIQGGSPKIWNVCHHFFHFCATLGYMSSFSQPNITGVIIIQILSVSGFVLYKDVEAPEST